MPMLGGCSCDRCAPRVLEPLWGMWPVDARVPHHEAEGGGAAAMGALLWVAGARNSRFSHGFCRLSRATEVSAIEMTATACCRWGRISSVCSSMCSQIWSALCSVTRLWVQQKHSVSAHLVSQGATKSLCSEGFTRLWSPSAASRPVSRAHNNIQESSEFQVPLKY